MDYTFRCEKCGKRFVVSHGISKPHPKIHQACGGKLVHVIGTQNIVYKGAGFFSVDKRLDRNQNDGE